MSDATSPQAKTPTDPGWYWLRVNGGEWQPVRVDLKYLAAAHDLPDQRLELPDERPVDAQGLEWGPRLPQPNGTTDAQDPGQPHVRPASSPAPALPPDERPPDLERRSNRAWALRTAHAVIHQCGGETVWPTDLVNLARVGVEILSRAPWINGGPLSQKPLGSVAVRTLYDAAMPLGYGVLWIGEGKCRAELRDGDTLVWEGETREHGEQVVGDAWVHATGAAGDDNGGMLD